MALASILPGGDPVFPLAMRFVQAGIPPNPFAWDNVQTELTKAPPPKMIMVLLTGSYTAVELSNASGGPPVGETCVQAGVPPKPLALVSTHVSLSGRKVQKGSPHPANTIIRLFVWS